MIATKITWIKGCENHENDQDLPHKKERLRGFALGYYWLLIDLTLDRRHCASGFCFYIPPAPRNNFF